VSAKSSITRLLGRGFARGNFVCMWCLTSPTFKFLGSIGSQHISMIDIWVGRGIFGLTESAFGGHTYSSIMALVG